MMPPTPTSRPSGRSRALSAAARVLGATGLLDGVGRVSARFELRRGTDRRVAFPWIRRRTAGSVTILLYHRVLPVPDPLLPSMPLDVFRRQMERLARGFNVISLDDAVRGLRDGRLPNRAVAITFDDGYRDNFAHAYPVLRDLGLTATMFLTTGVIGTMRRLWHDLVFETLHTARATSGPGLGPQGEDLDLSSARARTRSTYRVLAWLKSMSVPERDERLESIRAALPGGGRPGPADRTMLDWDEVRTMRNGGIRFGAHTVTHPILTQIPIAEAREEIERSKAELEARLGEPVSGFAYPNGGAGDFDEATRGLVVNAGFDWALTTVFGTNRASRGDDRFDPFALRRINAHPTGPAVFGAKLLFYDFADERDDG